MTEEDTTESTEQPTESDAPTPADNAENIERLAGLVESLTSQVETVSDETPEADDGPTVTVDLPADPRGYL